MKEGGKPSGFPLLFTPPTHLTGVLVSELHLQR